MSGRRQENFAKLYDDNRFDVIVVGGGVNGIGVFRELSLQGLRVLLVERNDFCSGCSAAPSRMIHGGLRYLENGEFDLVRESLRERDALLQSASHMVFPLPTVIPITSVFSGLFNAAASFAGRPGKPSNRGALPIKLGLTLYDLVTRNRRILPKHRFHSAKQTRRLWPALTRAARFSAVYHDAWISHPERLCIELIGDTTEAAPGSIALNHADLEMAGREFIVNCSLSGAQYRVKTRAVVNATGAWLDSTARALGKTTGKPMVSGTKGSHLILDHPELDRALDGHMIYYENRDGRVCIVFPYLGKVLAGSTDIRVETVSRVRCEDDERDYILESLRLVFPDIPVSPEQIVFSYSGIRPLPESGQSFTGRISRGHHVRRLDGPVPQFCMIGGKWTTFRAFAEQTADEVLRELGGQRRSHTLHRPIGGGGDFDGGGCKTVDRLVDEYGATRDRAWHLVGHYGSGAAAVLRFCRAYQDDRPLGAHVQHTSGEIAYMVRHELVETVADLALRRTSLAVTGAISLDLIDALGRILAAEAGLSPADVADQCDSLITELAEYHGVSADTLQQRNQTRSPQCV